MSKLPEFPAPPGETCNRRRPESKAGRARGEIQNDAKGDERGSVIGRGDERPRRGLLGRLAAPRRPRLPAGAGRTRPSVTARGLLLGLSLLLSPGALLRGGEPAGSAPAFNWVLPIFTDKEGYRLMTLRGSEVHPLGKSIAVTDLSITIFSGDAAAQVDTMLLSPSAVFVPKENRAYGDKTVRLIRDDMEVVGVGWTFQYEPKAKKVSLQQKVRVTFQTQLNDILK